MNWNPQWTLIAIIVVAALIIIAFIAAGVRRSRSTALRQHFGSEYDRTVKEVGSRTKAEDRLVARTEEAKQFDIRPLTASERSGYVEQWRKIEANFVERPTTAVVEADELITNVMRTRGYPMADFGKYAELLSVKHPRVVEHYRTGHATIDAHGRGAASTEDLRQSMLHYRALFQELVESTIDVERPVGTVREVEPARPAGTVEVRDEDRPR
ncbi:MAG TPA: hypothetical protein VF975_11485 [Thermoanaerobaculia bacterium]